MACQVDPSSRLLSSTDARPAISVTSTRMSFPTSDGSMWFVQLGVHAQCAGMQPGLMRESADPT